MKRVEGNRRGDMNTCQTCRTELQADATYCHKCGRRVRSADAREAMWSIAIPWAAGGAAVGALITLLVLRGSSPATPLPTGMPLGSSAGDISQMSPEERATRLFNRVMRLDEEGKRDSVAFFAPMALQSYAMLPARDADGRYHMGLLELAAGNSGGARAQADSIARLAPTHLFAFVLRARAGDARAFADFRRYERDERARGRPEYQDHAAQLDTFAQEAARTAP